MDEVRQLYMQVVSETGNPMQAIKAIRERFGLTLTAAKEVMIQADGSASSLSAHQQRLLPAALEALDELQTPTIRELDVVKPLKAIIVHVVGEQRSVTIPAGAEGTVVLLHKGVAGVEAYEVEFFLGKRAYALATIPASDLIGSERP